MVICGSDNMNIVNWGQKSKCIFAIRLAEKASSYLRESNVKTLIDEAIKVSWKWVYTEENVGELLYNFLDDEGNGFTLFQEIEEDPQKISAWDCIIDAIAYVSRAAYEKEGINYLPEPINIVDDNVLVHMIQSFILCNDNECEYVEKLCSDIKKESMKS